MPDLQTTISVQYQEAQKEKLRKYLYRFAEIRNLDLKIFPTHFINWINE
jgi:LytS/YehU family sensor histidine kinase